MVLGSALVRTTSFNHKQYRSIKEMIIDLKQEPGKVSESYTFSTKRTRLVQNGLHGLENGSNHSDRKVTFTLENDLEFPKFRKNRSLWLRMEMNRISITIQLATKKKQIKKSYRT